MAISVNYPLPDTSPWANGYIIEFPEDGEGVLIQDPIEIPADLGDRYHKCRDGENLRLIAHDFYSTYTPKAANLWWVIARANGIHNPTDMSEWVGKQIRIPYYPKFKLLL